MNIVMAGIDHNQAHLGIREVFAFSENRSAELYQACKNSLDIAGAVLVATCNRTELYLSFHENAQTDPFELLCNACGVKSTNYQAYSRHLYGKALFWHLCRTACGAESLLFGEDQIITQVKSAIAQAREHRAADNVLEVLFRTAVTAAKRIKTEVEFPSTGVSAAAAACDVIQRHGAKNVLVIGNGEVGRLAASHLVSAGCRVAMTVRAYRHGAVAIPPEVTAVDYGQRYAFMEGADAVISATRSPHYTIEAAQLSQLSSVPPVMVDLAVPRDADPGVAGLGVKLYDIDAVGRSLSAAERDVWNTQIDIRIQSAYTEFIRWDKDSRVEAPRRFPLFIDISGKTVLIAGGGKIAARRAWALSRSGCNIRLVAPEVSAEIQALARTTPMEIHRRAFKESDLTDVFLAVAATNSREVNHLIGVLAKAQGIPVSVADAKDECTFFFPSIINTDRGTIGVCGDGSNHSAVRSLAKNIRKLVNE